MPALKNGFCMKNLPGDIQGRIRSLARHADSQRRQALLPRLNSVSLFTIKDSGDYLIGIRLIYKLQRPSKFCFAEIVETEIVLRIPKSTNNSIVSCATGAEYIPKKFRANGTLELPWIKDGWPENYSYTDFAEDFRQVLLLPLATSNSKTPPPPPPQHHVRHPAPVMPRPSAPSMFNPPPQMARVPASQLPTELLSCPECNVVGFKDESSLNSHFMQLHVNSSSGGDGDNDRISIKCQYKDSTRRILFNAVQDDFEKAAKLITKGFSLPSAENIEFGYTDKEADWCIISSTESLREAIHSVCTVDNKTLVIEIKDIVAAQLINFEEPPPPTPKIREVSIKELKIGAVIGSGSSCVVYKASWRGTVLAVKKLTVSDPARKQHEFNQEVGMMSRIGSHPSIVLLLATCRNPLCLMFEFIPYSLFDLINRPEEKTVIPFPSTWSVRLQMMLDVARGLQFLHSFNVIHRDLKSLNLLVTESARVKLTDFGLARLAQNSNEVMTGCCGTYQWMAPEVIVSQQYSLSADIYSFAIVMWEISEASLPYTNLNATQAAMSVIHNKLRPTISSRVPEPIKNLLRRCWDQVADNRPTAAYVAEYLEKCLRMSSSTSQR